MKIRRLVTAFLTLLLVLNLPLRLPHQLQLRTSTRRLTTSSLGCLSNRKTKMANPHAKILHSRFASWLHQSP